VDDLRAAVLFAKQRGGREIFLGGHSTGCQKSIYYAHAMKAKAGIKGIILAAPVSDYAAAVSTVSKRKLAKATAYARKMVKSGQKHALMPAKMLTKWSINDAQRFLSLYTPDSIETMFPYEQPKNPARILGSIKHPILVLWAQKDQYADKPKEILAWFDAHIRAPRKLVLVPKVQHSFKGAEKMVASTIRAWMKSL
jgi:acetyl esterase/lipase